MGKLLLYLQARENKKSLKISLFAQAIVGVIIIATVVLKIFNVSFSDGDFGVWAFILVGVFLTILYTMLGINAITKLKLKKKLLKEYKEKIPKGEKQQCKKILLNCFNQQPPK
jgi:hypothetical protein